MPPSWCATLAYPPHWVELRLHAPADLDAVGGMIRALAAADAAQGAVVSAHGHPAGLHRHLTVWVLPRLHEAVTEELAALAIELSHAGADDLAAPRISRCPLPAGPALRIVRLEAALGDESDDATTGPVVLSLSYLVPVADPHATLWLRFWTPHLLASDTLATEFDTIAHTLEVIHPAPEAQETGPAQA